MPRPVAIILARAGSKGVPGKNKARVGGRPCALWTIDDAKASTMLSRIVVSTDDADIAALARSAGVEVVERPGALATDGATVDDAARHALRTLKDETLGPVVILYANVPVRPAGLIDAALGMLLRTGADSVQSYAPVGKHHPWWTARIDDASGAVTPWEGETLNNGVHRRQDLSAAYVPDGGVLVVTRDALELRIGGVAPGPHAFFGNDRRGVINPEGSVIDIDTPRDLLVADAALRVRRGETPPAGEPHAAHSFEPPDCATFAGEHTSISGRDIGRGHAPYVIAEIGVNHDGSLERALELVDGAADAGADAVKVQIFRAESLMSGRARLADYQRATGERDAQSMLRRLELSEKDLRLVVEHARRRRIHAIATVFSVDLVGLAQRIGFDAYKTASPDVVHRPLIEALARTGAPLIVSTGGATPDEVWRACVWLRDAIDQRRVALLQCVSAYPTADEDAALGGVMALARQTGLPVGYSDHTTGVDTGAMAVCAGASVLEKHLTYDRQATGPDHAASIEPEEFERYVRLARRAWRMLGEHTKRVLDVERDVRGASRQSIVAARALGRGETIQPGDVAFKRPGAGLEPHRVDEVVGRRAARAIEPDAPITLDDLT